MKSWKFQLKLVGKGPSLSLFLSKLLEQGMILEEITVLEETLVFSTSSLNFPCLYQAAYETKTRIKVKKGKGILFFFHKYKKRKALILGPMIAFLLVWFLSGRIWMVTFGGNEQISLFSLKDFLQEENFYYGRKKSEISCELLEEKLRESFPQVTWVSVAREGCVLKVALKESTINKVEIPSLEPSNLVAEEDGKVYSIVTGIGTGLVKKGDVVKKGETLIAGRREYWGDDSSLIHVSYGPALGKVVLECKEVYEEAWPLWQKQWISTGKRYYEWKLQWGEKVLSFSMPFDFSQETVYASQKTMPIFWQHFFPLSIKVLCHQQVQEKKVPISSETARAYLFKRYGEATEKLRKKGVSIIENNVKIILNRTMAKAEGYWIFHKEQKERRVIIVHDHRGDDV